MVVSGAVISRSLTHLAGLAAPESSYIILLVGTQIINNQHNDLNKEHLHD
jgi:hypothetical protein